MVSISVDDARLLEELADFLGRTHCVRVARNGKRTLRALIPAGLDEDFVAGQLRFYVATWESGRPRRTARVERSG